LTHYDQSTKEIQYPIIHNTDYDHTSPKDINIGKGPLIQELDKMRDIEDEALRTNTYDGSYPSQRYLNARKINILSMTRSLNNYLPFDYRAPSRTSSKDYFYILSLIWVTGVLISSFYILWLQISYSLKIKNSHNYTNQSIISNYYSCKSQMKIQKEIPLIISSKVKAPALMGVFKPKILISPNYIDLLKNEDLKFVFMHELAHYKRKDILVRWILVFLQILHWFNPVLWFAFYQIRQDCETACDAHVLSSIDRHEYKKYGNTMIKMLDIFSGYDYIPGSTGMLNRKKFIFERVRSIMNFKKNYIKWTLFGIAIFVALAAFLLTNGKKPPEEVIKITYDAQEIGKNSEVKLINGIKPLSNGQMLVYDMKSKKFTIINKDGSMEKTITCQDSPKDKTALFTVDSQDKLYVLSTDPTLAINVYDLMGKRLDKIELKDADISKAEQIFNWDLEVDSNGNIYVLIPQSNIQIFDSKGSKIKTLNQNGCSFIELDEEDNLYIGGYNKKDYIVKLNPLEDIVLWEIKDDNRLISLKNAEYSIQSKTLYVGNRINIVSIDSEGKSIDKVFQIDSLINEHKSFGFTGLTLDSDGNIYFYGFDRSSNKSLLYKTNTNKHSISSDDMKSLTISVRYITPTLEYAINKFENIHPDILINVENYNAFSWIMSDMTYEDSLKSNKEAFQKQYDFIQKINTQMLTGKGPDIIHINNMPYREYADKNLLLDLNTLMEEDNSFDTNLYYANILDAMEYKDKLYTIPLTVDYNAFCSNVGFLKTHSIDFDANNLSWNDFITLAQETTRDVDGDGKIDMYGMPTIAPEKMFGYMINSTTRDFIDYENKAAYFKSQEFMDLLKTCKTICSGAFVNPNVTEFSTRDGGFAFLPYTIDDFVILFGNGFMNAEEISFYKYPNSDKDQYTFSTSDMYGINSNTKCKEEAWEFIKFLLSEEVQSYEKLFGIPICKKARENKVQSYLSEVEKSLNEFGDVYGYKVSSREEFRKQLNDNIEKLDKIIPKLNNCNTYNIQIQKILNEETEGFFNGNKSVEETAQIIQRKIEMYLNE
jgi:beta-lactamase regulating signal transducer with metallopeptidase domain/ABC-type glycerol-3-phosphate transport system substrate-binding protein